LKTEFYPFYFVRISNREGGFREAGVPDAQSSQGSFFFKLADEQVASEKD
jgi:hypothetical protein